MLTTSKAVLLLICTTLPEIYSYLNDQCDKDDCGFTTRYIFYDVNPPEGFNLRRDVYMRYATFAANLEKTEPLTNYKLVLPPWSMLYHWRRKDEPEQLPWGLFFDVESMQKFAPVIEMHQFFDEIRVRYGTVHIDEVYVLQHYKDMFASGKFEEKMSIEPCNDDIVTSFFHYDNVTSHNIRCLSFHGFASQLRSVLKNSTAQSILFDHGEVALHDRFGDKTYWKCRRSMRFSKDLVHIADEFRKKFLNSTNEQDGTSLPNDWIEEKPRRTAKGGPYLSVHMRRRDFVHARPKQVPSVKNAALQIRNMADKLKLQAVFVATDSPEKEFEELKSYLGSLLVFKYKPNKEVKKKYRDGGIAIIEQIICSHARYFMGSYESTFSFRIQEEREIMGFPVETTFNRLCGNSEGACARTSMWKIEY